MSTPLLDICMLVHDQAGWADLAIRAVEYNTKNPYRLIIADSASKEPRTHAVLAEAEKRGHTVIRLAENRSFSSGVNTSVGVGSSKFICFLNSDCVVTEGWDSALLQDASEKPVGLVGARSNYVAGAQGNPAFIGEPPYIIFVCAMMRREVWSAVGPLDSEVFTGFSCEDIDYSFRVRKAGYKLKVSNAYVLHAGSRTLAATVGDGERRMANNNKFQVALEQKWGKEWVAEKSKLQERGLVTTYHPNDWCLVEFLKNLMGLRRSDGVGFEYLQVSRAPIHMARQMAADFALDSGFDWWVQIDDDAQFPSDILRKLLSHQKDVVTTLAYQRKPPHLPCIFEVGPDGLLGAPLVGWENTGLRKVDMAGYHCSIMRTSVIRKLRDAGIRQYFGGFENKLGEDMAFSLNLRKIGVPIHCDTDVDIGHIGAGIIVNREYKRKFDAGQK